MGRRDPLPHPMNHLGSGFQDLKTGPDKGGWWKDIKVYFTIANVMYLLGALIVAGAMIFFMTQGFFLFGGWGMCILSAIYCTVFVFVGHSLLEAGRGVPAALFYMLAIFTAPLFTYGIQYSLKKGITDEYDTLFYWLHANKRNAVWVPMELSTLVASAIAMWHLPSPFILIPGWGVAILLTRDFPQLLSGNQRLTQSLISILISFGILGMTYFFEYIGLPKSIDLGMSFLPDSSTWGYFAFVASLKYSLSSAGRKLKRHSANELADILYTLALDVVVYHLVFEDTDFVFIPASVFAGGCFLLTLVLPRFLFNKPLELFTGVILVLDGVGILISPYYYSSIHPLLVVFSPFRIPILVFGLGAVTVGAMTFTRFITSVHGGFIIQLVVICFPCAVLNVEMATNGVPSAIMFEVIMIVSCLVVWMVLSDKKLTQEGYAHSIILFGCVMLGVAFGVDHSFISHPFLNRVGFIPTAQLLGIATMYGGFTLREKRWEIPVIFELGSLICSGLLYVVFDLYFVLFFSGISLWALAVDIPQLSYTFTYRWANDAMSLSSMKGGFFVGLPLFIIAALLDHFPNPIFPCLHGNVAVHFFYLEGYIMTWIMGTMLLFHEALFSHNLPVSYFNKHVALHFIVNLVSPFIFPDTGFYFFNLIALLGFQIYLAIDPTITSSLLNFGLGLAMIFISIGTNYYNRIWFFASLAFELFGIFGVGLGSASLTFYPQFHMPRDDARSRIVFYFLSAFCLLVLSSFPSPSRGYLIFLLGAGLGIGSYALVVERRRYKNSSDSTILAARCGTLLAGCALMLLSPTFENILLFISGLAVSQLPLARLLLSKTAGNCFACLLLTLVFIVVGVALQSKLVVSLGGFYIFLTINILASVIFPSSILFPFILTFCGLAFIFVGQKFESDTFMDMFKLEQFGATSQGRIGEFTKVIVESIGGKLANTSS